MEKRYAKKDYDKKSYGGDDDGDKGGFGFRRRRARPAVDAVFDYKDIETIKQYITDEGKLIPGRVSKMNRTQQRQLTNAVKRARHLALIPTSPKHF